MSGLGHSANKAETTKPGKFVINETKPSQPPGTHHWDWVMWSNTAAKIQFPSSRQSNSHVEGFVLQRLQGHLLHGIGSIDE
jgi:hypothetical protein